MTNAELEGELMRRLTAAGIADGVEIYVYVVKDEAASYTWDVNAEGDPTGIGTRKNFRVL